MGIDVPDAESEQVVVVDHGEHLDVYRGLRLRVVAEEPEDLAALREVAERQFPSHTRVGEDGGVVQQLSELRVAAV